MATKRTGRPAFGNPATVSKETQRRRRVTRENRRKETKARMFTRGLTRYLLAMSARVI